MNGGGGQGKRERAFTLRSHQHTSGGSITANKKKKKENERPRRFLFRWVFRQPTRKNQNITLVILVARLLAGAHNHHMVHITRG